MTIHATAIIVHDCKVHLEPTGPTPGDAEQRLRHEVSIVSSADNCLRGILSGMTAIAKPPRKCQHCSETIDGGGFVIVGTGVMHHGCFADALDGKKPIDRIVEMEAALELLKSCEEEARRERDDLKAKWQTACANLDPIIIRAQNAERERDEARQMHRERVFYERAMLEEQIKHLGERLTKLRVAAQAVCDCKPGQYIGDKIDELRRAMG